MTICIAAITKEGKEEVIVFVTDHMVTTNIGSFEYTIKKYKMVDKSIVVMLAGDMTLFSEFIKDIPSEPSFEEIKQKIFENMKKTRKEIIQNAILNSYGLDWNDIRESLKSESINDLLAGIIEEIDEFELESQIILTGFNNDKVEIYEITEVGIEDYSDHHFHAIGSGMDQASNTLLFQKHSREQELAKTIYNVFKAKTNAQVMEGVGRETEILILRKNGRLTEVSQEDLDLLRRIYDEDMRSGEKHQGLKNLKSLNYKEKEVENK